MMRSSYNSGMMGEDDDDEFAPPQANPFATNAATHPDLFGAPTPAMMQQQQQQPMQQQPNMMYGQPQQQPMMQQNMMYGQQPQQQQQPMPYHDPYAAVDPSSGLSGQPLPPSPSRVTMDEPDPSQYLSGSMDNKSSTTVENYGVAARSGVNTAGGAPEAPPPPFWSLRGLLSCCLNWQAYQRYFDVDTIDIRERILAALLKFHQPDYFRTVTIGDLAQDAANAGVDAANATPDQPVLRKGPDLYGPFWLTMTLVFALAMTSNLAGSMEHQMENRSKHAKNKPHTATTSAPTLSPTVAAVETDDTPENDDGGGDGDGGDGDGGDGDGGDGGDGDGGDGDGGDGDGGDGDGGGDGGDGDGGDGDGGDGEDGVGDNRKLAFWQYGHDNEHSRRLDETSESAYEYDLQVLLHAFWVVVSFADFLPMFFWLTTKCLGMNSVAWPMWICIYGYSLVPILAACFVAWIPFELVRWIALGCAMGASLLLVVRNLSTPLFAQDGVNQAKAAPIILSIVGTHAVFFMILKFWFFP